MTASSQAAVVVPPIVPADLKSGLEDHGSGIRCKIYHPIQPARQLRNGSNEGLLAYIQLHLVAGDLKINVIELEEGFINMTQYLRYPII
jgi:hypothetical protein